MMISWPEKITPRRDSTLMIAFADLYPSLLSLMGFKDRIPAEVQTFDLSASILSPENTQEIVQPYYYLLPENLTTGYRGLRTKNIHLQYTPQTAGLTNGYYSTANRIHSS